MATPADKVAAGALPTSHVERTMTQQRSADLEAMLAAEAGGAVTSTSTLSGSTSASLLNELERAVHADYARHKTGNFVNPKHEISYRLRMWTAGQTVRRAGIIFVSLAAVIHVSALTADLVSGGGDVPRRLREDLPTVSITLLGVACMWLGWTPRQWVVRHWNVIATVGLSLIASPVIAVYPLVLCGETPTYYAQCKAVDAGVVPWEPVVFMMMAAVIGPYSLHVGWLASFINSMFLTLLITVAFGVGIERQRAFKIFTSMTMVAVMTTVAARLHETAERDFWASLRSTARAQFLQGRAEERGAAASRRRDLAEAKSEAAQSVMRYVCHELRNPLHGIMGLLEGVITELGSSSASEELEVEPWVLEDVTTVEATAKNMAVILNDVLDLGQLQRGAMALDTQPTDAVALIDGCVLPLRGASTVPIVAHIAESVPPTLVVDALRVGQVITNGVSNAAKLTKEGVVEVVAYVRDDKLHISVLDTGCGLSVSPTHLFRPYAQDTHGHSRQTHDRFQKGTGLGLAISAQLVRLMGGEIGLENRTDGVHGAHFWFWVPCSATQDTFDLRGSVSVTARDRHRHDDCNDGTSQGSGSDVVVDIDFGDGTPSLPHTYSRASSHSAGASPYSLGDTSARSRGRKGGALLSPTPSPALTNGAQVVSGTIRSLQAAGRVDLSSSVMSPHASHAGAAYTLGLAFRDHRLYNPGGHRLPMPGSPASFRGRVPATTSVGVERVGRTGDPEQGVVRGCVDAMPGDVPGVANSPSDGGSVASIERGASTSAPAATSGAGSSIAPVAACERSPQHEAGAVGIVLPSEESKAAATEAGGGDSGGGVVVGALPAKPKPRRKRAPRSKSKSRAPKPCAGYHVLVCDDERLNRTVLARYCKQNGCTVRKVDDGDHLLAMLENGDVTPDGQWLVDSTTPDRRPFHVVFLDILMQRTNGEDVCRALRAAGIRTPLVATTGNGVQDDLDRYDKVGFSRVMLKPFGCVNVLDTVKALEGQFHSQPVVSPASSVLADTTPHLAGSPVVRTASASSNAVEQVSETRPAVASPK